MNKQPENEESPNLQLFEPVTCPTCLSDETKWTARVFDRGEERDLYTCTNCGERFEREVTHG